MSKVAVKLKVLPQGPDVDLEQLKAKINSKIHIADAKIEPLAFGLKQLSILILMPDVGGTEQIEKTIRSIEGVQDVVVESVTLV